MAKHPEFDRRDSTRVSIPVAVITRFEITDQPWDAGCWDVVGVVAGTRFGDAAPRAEPADAGENRRQLLWGGLALTLYHDDVASYYHNLMGREPRVFVLAREAEEGHVLEPWLATVSYDEAGAYMEVEESVYSVPIPPELYGWIERFVLEHYVPEPRRKRKREDWKKTGRTL